MKMKMIVFLIFASILFVGCSNENSEATDIKKLVDDYTVGNIKAESASITSSELLIKDENQKEIIHDLPEDEFFVSVAPFINQTHPCEIHSLTSCQGELIDEDVDVLIKNSDGDIVLDETRQTEANGFIDLWLPRDDTFDVIMTMDGKETSSEISTFDGDHTCITTMQLK